MVPRVKSRGSKLVELFVLEIPSWKARRILLDVSVRKSSFLLSPHCPGTAQSFSNSQKDLEQVLMFV